MAKDYIGYETLADNALRTVVREALKRAEKQGLIGGHHFYIAFKTHDPGVEIPDHLKERYPDEMTIVLQNQFWGLQVGEDKFEVTLTFQKMPATLVIPYAALTAFTDPGVKFGLQFRNSSAAANAMPPAAKPTETAPAPLPVPPAETKTRETVSEAEHADTGSPQVVSLDKFRKK
jgi:hypothetical protein